MSNDLEEAWKDIGVPPEDNGCIRCRKTVNTDGSEVMWRCAGCNRLVCRDCTLCEPGPRGSREKQEYQRGYAKGVRDAAEKAHGTGVVGNIIDLIPQVPDEPTYSHVPSPGGIRYMDDTLCSLKCWERIGKPED